jgi:beta-phosphoglucomutase-like phosphatase (HAD superfamily)
MPASYSLAFLSGGLVLKAIIFDIDGTLVDSVDIHAMAWQEALHKFGYNVEYQRLRSQVGKGGDKLIPEFVPPDQLDAVQKKLSDFRSEMFKRKYLSHIRPLSCVPELMQKCQDEGLRVALASSAQHDELQAYVKLLGIQKFVEEKTSKDDAKESKPAPDIFQAALAKLEDITPAEALVIGDTPYDAIAARRTGMRCIGVLTGGWKKEELMDAGCFEVYRGIPEIFAMYDESPLAQHREKVA